ncbi:MAG: glycosyltransferase family 39 protein [Anaerolineae bacterium]|nr:glycosyltransferase family 39 protein [Anaerolineae bacterium]
MENRGTTGRLAWWEWGGLVVILLVAFALRAVALTEVPPGLRYDELLNHRMAWRVLAGERPLFFTDSWGHEPLFHYLQALSIAWAGDSDWSLRFPAVWFGFFGVLTTWLAARRIFGSRVAILTAAFMTPAFWSLFYSREGSRVIAIVPMISLAVYLFWRGLEQAGCGRRGWATLSFVTGGISLGGMFYLYVAARVVPALPIFFTTYLALFHPRQFKRVRLGVLAFLVIAAGIAAPLMVLLTTNPAVEERLEHLSAPLDALREGDAGPVIDLCLRAAGMFFWEGEADWLYNVSGRPLFDPLTAACFALGILLSLWHWRRPRYVLVLLWLGVGLLPTMVVPPAASFSHAIASQPAAYMLAALGVEALWLAVSKRWRIAAPFLAIAILLFHGTLSSYAFFRTWGGAPEVWGLYQGGVSEIARELDRHDPPGPVAIGAPYINYWHPWNAVNFDLALRRSDLDVRWFNPAGALIWPAGSGPITFYFPDDPLGTQAFDPALEALFITDAVVVEGLGKGFRTFRATGSTVYVDRLAMLSPATLAWPPEMSHIAVPEMPLAFGNRFILAGVSLEESCVEPGGTIRMLTYWEVLSAQPTPVVAFVHLTSDGRDIWGQQDWFDVRAESLRPGDRFVQVHTVAVRAETPPGEYVLQLGLYAPDTLIRLPVDALGDRVWIAGITVAP